MRVAAAGPPASRSGSAIIKIVVAERLATTLTADRRHCARAELPLEAVVTWVTRSIRSACAWASTAPGTAAGSPACGLREAAAWRPAAAHASSQEAWPAPASARVVIERPAKKPRVTIYAARPGVSLLARRVRTSRHSARSLTKMAKGEVTPQHRRDPQAGDRCGAGGREHRPAARASRGVPSCDEARRAVGDASRRPGHPHQLRAAVSAALRSPARNGIARGAFRLHTLRADIDLRHRYGQDDLRHVRREGLDLQGRDPRPTIRRLRTVAPPNRRRSGKDELTMMSPKRTKFRKAHKGRIHGLMPRAAPR